MDTNTQLLLREMRHIAGISTGQVKRVAEQALAAAQQAQPDLKDAYAGAREDVAIWKKRALEAEALNRKFIAEVNGPTFMGEPVQQPAEPKRCIPCRNTGLWHCSDPENCGGPWTTPAPQPKEPATYTPPKIIDPDAPHPCFN